MKAHDCKIGMIVTSKINCDVEYEVIKLNKKTCSLRTTCSDGFVYSSVKYSILTPKQNNMETNEKIEKIRELVHDMLTESYGVMVKRIDRAIYSGAIDIDAWNPNDKPMILPKIITTAILRNESTQYDGKGTSFEKQIKKEVKNLQYFL